MKPTQTKPGYWYRQLYDHRELIDMMQWLANRLGYEFRRKVKPSPRLEEL